MLQALALAVSLVSPVLAVTPVIPANERPTIPDACRADFDRLNAATQTVVAYRDAVALLTKGSAPTMPGPLQQQKTDAYDKARGSLGKPTPGPTQQAQTELVQLYAAAAPMDDLVMQYATDLQGYVDAIANVTGSEPKSIQTPAANAPQEEVQAWNAVQQDITNLNEVVAKIDAALSAERDAQRRYLDACRGGSAATPAPVSAPVATPSPASAATPPVVPAAAAPQPKPAAATAAPTVAPTSSPAAAPLAAARSAPSAVSAPSPAAAQLRRAFAGIIAWLNGYKAAHGEYPDHVNRMVLVNADALNPFHTEFGYRKVRATYYLGTFTGLCGCDNAMAAAFAKYSDWYENAGKHPPFHAPGIWYTPSVFFR